ncbi:MAG TPA: hypothetical protein VE990_17615 [Acidimicrobiales bacterium]|nr:hypothetical protein [Acidimicrobiales bacterium]
MEVKLSFVTDVRTTLRARLVLHPGGDLPAGYGSGGIVVENLAVHVSGRAGGLQWVPIVFPSPVAVVSLPGTGTYSIDIDLPIEPDVAPYGARIGWYACGAAYTRGRGHFPLSADSFRRQAANGGMSWLPTSTSTQPVADEPTTGYTDSFEFRVFGS